ncbi:uncharacterized protein B0P05DRAFT_527910 [Gilbertella persicaria]|uniref:uncharacterized protein n=1 Tax=Gilbertella persicaria TaxID=101096 RepID=UPI002220B6DC|nr:uncharacterized protein B0P05DRAFT_527910 [Gilbertella persicaria]KAI8090905.1 hypothetical protein B0P05DRAFT_527910 [Gilbertella persicaria]
MKETLIDAINTIDLLQSIYFDKEFEFKQSEDAVHYQELQANIENNTFTTDVQQLEFYIKAPIDRVENQTEEGYQLYLTFYGRISLVSDDYKLDLPSTLNLWLSRDDHEALVHALHGIEIEAERSTCIIEKMQQLQTIAEPYALAWLDRTHQQAQREQALAKEPVRFLRDWIWFPMIYTREKRGHIVDWAPKYNITGFLCPGKPGCMCLEGPEKQIAQFVNDIKTISWADIPASHKKMASRWKQIVNCQDKTELDSHRLFKDMQEVKFDIHGKFANHNDLCMLQQWLNDRGCSEAFDHLFKN